MTGSVQISRRLHRTESERNARVVDVISLRAGVVGDSWLPRAAEAIAHLIQSCPSRETGRTANRFVPLPHSRPCSE